MKYLRLVVLLASPFRLHLPIVSQLSAMLDCRTNKADGMGFVTGVPRNAKTKAASSRRFELDSSSSELSLGLIAPLMKELS